MTAQDKINAMVAEIENGKTLIINAHGAIFKLKKSYKAWKHWGPEIFAIDNSGMGIGVSIKSGNTSGPITNVGID